MYPECERTLTIQCQGFIEVRQNKKTQKTLRLSGSREVSMPKSRRSEAWKAQIDKPFQLSFYTQANTNLVVVISKLLISH